VEYISGGKHDLMMLAMLALTVVGYAVPELLEPDYGVMQ